MSIPLQDEASQDIAVEDKNHCQKSLTFNPPIKVTNSFSTFAALTKVTFKETVGLQAKKLRSLVNINKPCKQFRLSTATNFNHQPQEMDTDPTTQEFPPMATVTPSMALVTDQTPPSPRRFTFSTFPTILPQTRKNGGNGQCTHITTTRLYTEDFRCAQCLNLGSFGWLYRCTQDRELLLEEDIERGCEVSLLQPKGALTPRI